MLVLGCNGEVEPETRAVDQGRYLALGDSISAHAQQVLLQNVAAAMKEGGPQYAVDFCNTRAIPLTDSVAARYEVVLQRLSDRNRNPGNALASDQDRVAWKRMQTAPAAVVEQDETGGAWYYAPIFLAMPACMKCHGGADDVDPGTRTILAERYPNDQAMGYQLGDLRGMWKIGFLPTE